MTPCGFRDHAEQRVKRIERCKTRRNSPALKNSHILRKNNLTIPPTDPCHKHQGKQRTSTRKTGVSVFLDRGLPAPQFSRVLFAFRQQEMVGGMPKPQAPYLPPYSTHPMEQLYNFPQCGAKEEKKTPHTLSLSAYSSCREADGKNLRILPSEKDDLWRLLARILHRSTGNNPHPALLVVLVVRGNFCACYVITSDVLCVVFD